MVTIPVSCGKVRNKENKLTLFSKNLPFRVPFITVLNVGKEDRIPQSPTVILKAKKTVPYTYSLKYKSGHT